MATLRTTVGLIAAGILTFWLGWEAATALPFAEGEAHLLGLVMLFVGCVIAVIEIIKIFFRRLRSLKSKKAT